MYEQVKSDNRNYNQEADTKTYKQVSQQSRTQNSNNAIDRPMIHSVSLISRLRETHSQSEARERQRYYPTQLEIRSQIESSAYMPIEPIRQPILASKLPKSKTHTPRPSNSFILYRKDKHIDIMARLKNENGVNNNVVSKVVAEMWRNEDVEVKAHYAEMAEEAKRAHSLKYPDYKYRPRKAAPKSAPSLSKAKAGPMQESKVSPRYQPYSASVPHWNQNQTFHGATNYPEDYYQYDPRAYAAAPQARLGFNPYMATYTWQEPSYHSSYNGYHHGPPAFDYQTR